MSDDFLSLDAATLRSMARDIGFTPDDLRRLGQIAVEASQRPVLIEWGVLGPLQDEALLYSASLLPSGEIAITIDVPSLAVMISHLATERPDVSPFVLYSSLLHHAPYDTLHDLYGIAGGLASLACAIFPPASVARREKSTVFRLIPIIFPAVRPGFLRCDLYFRLLDKKEEISYDFMSGLWVRCRGD